LQNVLHTLFFRVGKDYERRQKNHWSTTENCLKSLYLRHFKCKLLWAGGDRVTILKLALLQISVYLPALASSASLAAHPDIFCSKSIAAPGSACSRSFICSAGCTDLFCPFLLVLDLLLPGFDANCQFTRFNVSLTSGKISVILHCRL